MRKIMAFVLCTVLLVTVTGCSGTEKQAGDYTFYENSVSSGSAGQTDTRSSREDSGSIGGSKVLVAYFSRVGNTDFEDDVDAVTSASLMEKDGVLYGNTQYIAALIQDQTGGDLFLIETEEKYPSNYDETDEQGGRESREKARPKLASHVENLEEYHTVYLGFPNWYYGMPMAVYTFLEEHDLSGKRIIPFVTSGGSGFSDAISEIQKIQPEADVVPEGFEVTHSKVDEVSSGDIKKWISGLK